MTGLNFIPLLVEKLKSTQPEKIILFGLYIDARYPGELGLLPDGKPSISEARAFYNLGKMIYESAKQE